MSTTIELWKAQKRITELELEIQLAKLDDTAAYEAGYHQGFEEGHKAAREDNDE